MELRRLTEIKPNPENPRAIRDDKFKKLVKSLKAFPEMAAVRPVVVNVAMTVLGGNMRLRAMKEAGWKEAPVEVVDWSLEKQREFIIKDNVGFGEWDWDELANTWHAEELNEWGLDFPNDFDTAEPDEGQSFKITLEYTEEDYSKLMDAFMVFGSTKEEVVFNALIKEDV